MFKGSSSTPAQGGRPLESARLIAFVHAESRFGTTRSLWSSLALLETSRASIYFQPEIVENVAETNRIPRYQADNSFNAGFGGDQGRWPIDIRRKPSGQTRP